MKFFLWGEGLTIGPTKKYMRGEFKREDPYNKQSLDPHPLSIRLFIWHGLNAELEAVVVARFQLLDDVLKVGHAVGADWQLLHVVLKKLDQCLDQVAAAVRYGGSPYPVQFLVEGLSFIRQFFAQSLKLAQVQLHCVGPAPAGEILWDVACFVLVFINGKVGHDVTVEIVLKTFVLPILKLVPVTQIFEFSQPGNVL